MTAEQAYRHRLQQRQQRFAHRDRQDGWIANARLVVFCSLLAAWWWAYQDVSVSYWLLAPIGVVFAGLLVWHDRVLRDKADLSRRIEHYERGLRRLGGGWAGTGAQGLAYAPGDGHPYAVDLDLFGPGSLFERMCTTPTGAGERTLAQWLLHGADPATLATRQRLVRALCAHPETALDIWEDLAAIRAAYRAQLEPQSLEHWAAAPSVFPAATSRARGMLRFTTVVLTGAMIAAVGAWAFTGAGPLPFLCALVPVWAWGRYWRTQSHTVMAAVSAPEESLAMFARVLGRAEGVLQSVLAEGRAAAREATGEAADEQGYEGREGLALLRQTPRPSRLVRQLQRRLGWLNAQRNPFFAPFGSVLLWPLHTAQWVESWRCMHGPALHGWLQALGKFEALQALACYRYERPDDVMPTWVRGHAHFVAKGLGHPLLPADGCVRNDVALRAGDDDNDNDNGAEAPSLLVVTGSNMSGKSTLLRAVGLNVVLAMMGAPVRAVELCLSPLQVGATLAVHDSIQSGESRFYNELRRLQRILEMAGGSAHPEAAGPFLLFLLDELFHGTNAHDRRVGAGGLLRALGQRGAVGLVTTHDLAVVRTVVGDNGKPGLPGVAPVHFEDRWQDDQLTFDYLLRAGVAEKGNGLALMRSMGLKVADEEAGFVKCDAAQDRR